MRKVLCFLWACQIGAVSIEEWEKQSLLYRAGLWSKSFAQQIARSEAPSLLPQTKECLETASVWYSIDANELEAPLVALTQVDLWDQLQQMGVQAVEVRHLKMRPADAGKLADLAGVRGLALIGDPLATLQDSSADFQLAIRNYKDYPYLFHLVEIDEIDWGFLPRVTPQQVSLPLAEITVQELQKKGYLAGRPDAIYPNAAESAWEATPPTLGVDGKPRRWVFLRLPTGRPAVNWLDPSFAGQRLAGGELVDRLLRLQQSIVVMDATPLIGWKLSGRSPSENAMASLALLSRKLGGFSAGRVDAPIGAPLTTDLLYDRFTRPALLHALIAEDAEALRLIYRTFLQEGVQPRHLIHEMAPYETSRCEWTEFLLNPKKTYRYYEEEVTGALLAERLLNEDLDRLRQEPSLYTPPIAPLYGLCPDPAHPPKSQFLQAQMLLAFFNAMQPGAFVFSAQDVKGAGLYPPLARQLKDANSFAGQLQALLRVRREQQLEQAELLEVLPTAEKGLLLLLHRLPSRLLSLTAINFSRHSVVCPLQGAYLSHRWPINLVTGQAEPKRFAADTFEMQLDALTGKIFLFQPKYTETEAVDAF